MAVSALRIDRVRDQAARFIFQKINQVLLTAVRIQHRALAALSQEDVIQCVIGILVTISGDLKDGLPFIRDNLSRSCAYDRNVLKPGKFHDIFILAGRLFQFLCDLRDDNVFIREQSTIHVRKCCKLIRQIQVCSLIQWSIQRLEQLDQRTSHILRLVLHQILTERILLTKQASILRIEAEHKSNTENVQALLCPLRQRVIILREEPVTDLTD